jgi:hypothetical protein
MYAVQQAANDFVDIITQETSVFGCPHFIIYQANCILLPLLVDGSTLRSNPVHNVLSIATAF